MKLNADELTEARRVIAGALEEDLSYGPDVTTLATVPASSLGLTRRVSRPATSTCPEGPRGSPKERLPAGFSGHRDLRSLVPLARSRG